MKLYPTPSGYQTIYDKPLFEGACEECLGDGSYLHPLASRVTCLRCDGWGSEERRVAGLEAEEAQQTRDRWELVEGVLWLLGITGLLLTLMVIL